MRWAVVGGSAAAILTLSSAPALAAPGSPGPDFSVASTGGNLTLAVGQSTDGAIDVENSGAADSAQLTLTFPAQLKPSGALSDGTTSLTCSTTGQIETCTLPSGDTGTLNVPVTTIAAATPGPTSGIAVTVTPTGSTDPTPADNSTVIPATILPTAKLSFGDFPPGATTSRPSPAHADIPAGSQQHVRFTVTNDGPAIIPDLTLRFASQTNTRSLWTIRRTPSGAPLTFAEIRVGKLAVSKIDTVDLYVTASAPGATVLLTLLGESSAVFLVQPTYDRGGDSGIALNLASVAAVPATHASTPATHASTPAPHTTAPLANSGAPVGREIVAGLVALLAGLLLLLAGRRKAGRASH